ncbi:MAG: lactate racemase domain-containing protein, partial [Gaiellaceae bacterium]
VIADVPAAVRDALRVPLEGPSLQALVTPGMRRATIVVEPPALPVPASLHDPRQDALVAASDELERIGIPTGNQTILVATGLAPRAQRRELSLLVRPDFALRFHGLVTSHDAADPNLVDLGELEGIPFRVHRALVETDIVVCVSAAESILHGGPALLLAAGAPEALRATSASRSLLEAAGARGWRIAAALEQRLAQRVPVVGVSLALTSPRLGGVAAGWPQDARVVGRIARSPLRRLLAALPRALRWRLLSAVPVEIAASAVFAGPPSVAHAEALLAAIETRAMAVEEPLDALVVPVPDTTLWLPRQRPNPLAVSALGLGYALRHWRDAFPLVEDGTVILLHGFERRFAHPTQLPYRSFFAAIRFRRDREAVAEAEQAAAVDQRAIALYREGGTCHPLLPFADWAACQPAIERSGAVVVAACRDATAARQLGFIPSHGIGSALELAAGRAGREPRVGFVLGPPYPWLRGPVSVKAPTG